jgi:hypothetical protein
MSALRADGRHKLREVIDDQRHSGGPRDRLDAAPELLDLALAKALCAQLEDIDATRTHRFDRALQVRFRHVAQIRDSIEPRVFD